MKSRLISRLWIALLFVAFGAWIPSLHAQSATDSHAYDAYLGSVTNRLEQQHQSQDSFLALGRFSPQDMVHLRAGDILVEKMTPSTSPVSTDSMLHHWRATTFVPGATVANLEQLLQSYATYPTTYAPQVTRSQVIRQSAPGQYEVKLRVLQKHGLSVVLDSTYLVHFDHKDQQHGDNASHSVRIQEIEDAGSPSEHALSPTENHGFLWRQDTFWSYQEQDGGLYMQVESVSLSRSIPTGLAWIVRPFVESIPKESLTFTLQATCRALRHK